MKTTWILAGCLLASTLAHAAPPSTDASEKDTTPPDKIDVDAMARAKDTDASVPSESTKAKAPATDAKKSDTDAGTSGIPAGAPEAPQTPAETPAPTDNAAASSPATAGEAVPSDTPDASTSPPVPSQSPPDAASPTGSGAAEPATDSTSPTEDAGSHSTNATATPPSDNAPTTGDTGTAEPSQQFNTTAPTPDSEQKRQMAACESRATSLLDDAAKGDFAAATHDFNAKMRSAMPAEKFGHAWGSLSQFGKLEARGQSHRSVGEGYFIVNVPLVFEKANLYAQISCGSDGLIAGFYVKPLDVPAQ